MKKFIMFLSCALVLYACEKEQLPEDNNDQPDVPKEWQVGKNEYNKVIDGVERNFLVHVPQGYTGDAPVPLFFMLHGSGGSGARFYDISGWVQKSEEEHFIAVFPTGLEYPIIEKDSHLFTKWSSDGLVNQIPAGYPIKDDVPFIRELITWCEEQFNIDSRRIYISGFSNGGAFVRTRIMDEMNDRFAAASAGNIGFQEPLSITGYVMPFFQIVGSKDDYILDALGIQELPLNADQLLQIPQIAQQIAHLKTTLRFGDNYTESPHIPKYNFIVWADDLTGQGREFRLLLINDLKHRYPNGRNNPHQVRATDFLWDWFMQYTLPE